MIDRPTVGGVWVPSGSITSSAMMASVLLILLVLSNPAWAQSPSLQQEAISALESAVGYFRTVASCRGGYPGKHSEDLTRWIAEDEATPSQIWIQPPGTPSVGQVYLEAYKATGDGRYLEAARAAADSLIWGQLQAGGWAYIVDFLGEGRWRYRHEIEDDKSDENICTFDDDVSQSATMLLMALDHILRRDPYSDAAHYALNFMIRSQFPNGAWPQRYPLSGRYPNYYSDYYTFNDGAINDCIAVMMEAYRLYRNDTYLKSAERGGDFIIRSQLPAPQSGWAQQYYWNLSPAWARSFEPPAVCSKVTGRNIRTLLELYLLTGNETYLQPIPPAIGWLNRSMIGDNLWARFYEIGTNIPIYCDRGRKLTYNLSDLSDERRFGYGWQGNYAGSAVKMYREVKSLGREGYLAKTRRPLTEKERLAKARALEPAVRDVIDSLDEKGRWVEDGWINTKTFNRNVLTLARYLEYSGWNGSAPSLPVVRSFRVAPAGGGLIVEANVSHPSGTQIAQVLLRLTPRIGVGDMNLTDDGTGGDSLAGDGIYSLYLESTEKLTPSHEGLIVAYDSQRHWNLTTLPLGGIAHARRLTDEIASALPEAEGLGANVSSLAEELSELRRRLGNVSGDSDVSELLAWATNLSRRVEAATVWGLIEAASELIEEAKSIGVDTSRHEIFLKRAEEEYEKGNYVSARSFARYPLSLRESLDEAAPAMVVPIILLSLLLGVWREGRH